MISVISSYRIASSTSKILPTLEDVCQELTEKQFLAIDVLISEADIRAASKAAQKGALDELHCAKGDLTEVAQTLVERITGDVSSHRGAASTIPALATNFPKIGIGLSA